MTRPAGIGRIVRGNSELEFLPERVIKRYPRDVDAEFAKAGALWDLSRSARFVTPRPIALDAPNRAIVFERLVASRSIRDHYYTHMRTRGGDARTVELCREAGRVLGEIHRRIALPSQTPWTLPEDFLAALGAAGRAELPAPDALPQAFMHGDYGLENIETASGTAAGPLAIFDASPNNFTTFAADCRGPIYVDVGHFVSVIAGLVRPQHQLRFRWRNRRALAEAFIGGYEASSEIACDRKVVLLFARGTAGAYLRSRYPRLPADLLTRLTFSPHRGKIL